MSHLASVPFAGMLSYVFLTVVYCMFCFLERHALFKIFSWLFSHVVFQMIFKIDFDFSESFIRILIKVMLSPWVNVRHWQPWTLGPVRSDARHLSVISVCPKPKLDCASHVKAGVSQELYHCRGSGAFFLFEWKWVAVFLYVYAYTWCVSWLPCLLLLVSGFFQWITLLGSRSTWSSVPYVAPGATLHIKGLFPPLVFSLSHFAQKGMEHQE